MNRFFIYSPLLFQVTIWPITRLFLWFFGRLEVHGLENLKILPKGKAIIFASNHSSELDPFLTPASLPFFSRFIPLYYITKERDYYEKSGITSLFYGGFVFRFIGGVPVCAGLKNYSLSLINHVNILKDNRNIFVFPEGHITDDGLLGRARGGISYLSRETGTTIVPVGISGVYKMTRMDFFCRKRKIKVVFGPPISRSEIDRNINIGNSMPENIYKAESEYILYKIKQLL